jgi:hypothetical protein
MISTSLFKPRGEPSSISWYREHLHSLSLTSPALRQNTTLRPPTPSNYGADPRATTSSKQRLPGESQGFCSCRDPEDRIHPIIFALPRSTLQSASPLRVNAIQRTNNALRLARTRDNRSSFTKASHPSSHHSKHLWH